MTQQKIYLKDYTPPAFAVVRVDLDIRVFDHETLVDSTLVLKREHEGDLVLFGRELELLAVAIDGVALTKQDYQVDSEQLTIAQVPAGEFTLTTQVRIHPETNTALEGLYLAGEGDDAMFVTQCEAEGFRKITYYPDRPDVMSVFTTRVEADKKYPTLLANGNLVETGEVGDDRHYAIWHDPTKKPSYLFATVVADLAVLTDHYATSEGRDVLLELYASSHDIDKCHVGMQALKDAMKWDEDNYGRAYDLDRYMIVATGKFNMGAMENKGLNIFNTSCVLSSPETTTDGANFRVKSVIAHEYFHNWTGNRVTCRDWFQLCLKEGLTVFRDQSFSGDFHSKAVQRIEDVGVLRAAQFTEDAGALAHPARPDSFVTINNFYTATVYEKGAEIVRMMANWLGREKYRAGMDIYFERHDGQAVTVEDFVAALATQDEKIYDFLQWYKQPATPVLSGRYEYDDQALTIHLSQSIRHVDGYEAPKDLPIPVDVAVFDGQSGELLVSQMLLLKQKTDKFTLTVDLAGKQPLVSVLRGFSAPVILDFEYSDDDLAKLVRFETDGFNRWQAIQTLVNRYLSNQLDDVNLIANALKAAVDDLIDQDAMLVARLFDIPSEKEIASSINSDYVPKMVKARRDTLKQQLAQALTDKLDVWYQALPIRAYEDTPKATGERALRNVLLSLMAYVDKNQAEQLAVAQYNQANCMSERFGALMTLTHHNLPSKQVYLDDFYQRFSDEPLVIDNWYTVQVGSDSTDVDAISALLDNNFDWQTPNRVRAVFGPMSARPVLLWSKAGLALYLSALIKLDEMNPQLAARLFGNLSRWYTLADKATVKTALLDFVKQVKSKDTKELAEKILHAGD